MQTGTESGRAAHPHTSPTKRKMRSEDLSDELLPGLPNDITLDIIGPMLSSKEISVLSKVSPYWCKAVTGRLVYDARVRHQTETLVVVAKYHRICDTDQHDSLALFSERDQSLQQLPRIPGFRTGFPSQFQWATLDGKIYLLGGLPIQCRQCSRASSEVYVLDVAGQRQWQKCANMQSGRYGFKTTVMGGKIYVHGGMNGLRRGFRLRFKGHDEVYDPKLDVWSPTKMPPLIEPRPSISPQLQHSIELQGYCLAPSFCTIKL